MENRNKKTAIEPQVHHTLNDEEQQVLPFLQDTIRHTVEPYELVSIGNLTSFSQITTSLH